MLQLYSLKSSLLFRLACTVVKVMLFFTLLAAPFVGLLRCSPLTLGQSHLLRWRWRERYHTWRNVCFKPFLNSQKRVHRWYRMELIPSLAPPEHRQVLMRSPVFGRAKVPSCFFSLNDTDSAGSSSATSAESGELGTQRSSTQTASRNVRQK